MEELLRQSSNDSFSYSDETISNIDNTNNDGNIFSNMCHPDPSHTSNNPPLFLA